MTAVISDCQRYRYLLERSCEIAYPGQTPAVFIMLNPSTADASQDDPTIRRCRRFARDWACDGLIVANLYAFRCTNPAQLWGLEDPVGPDNNDHLQRIARKYGEAVCAWGANAKPDRVNEVVEVFRKAGARLWCLGTTKAGAPRHPLYIKADQERVLWLGGDV